MKTLYRGGCLAVLILLAQLNIAQLNIGGVVNIYTPVSAINVPNNEITVNSVAGFSVGDEVVLYQAQGAGYTTANNSSYGDLSARTGGGA